MAPQNKTETSLAIERRAVAITEMKAGDVLVVEEDHLANMTVRYLLPRATH
jgi:hypothetical protein